jgi:hypothetical protein
MPCHEPSTLFPGFVLLGFGVMLASTGLWSPTPDAEAEAEA